MLSMHAATMLFHFLTCKTFSKLSKIFFSHAVKFFFKYFAKKDFFQINFILNCGNKYRSMCHYEWRYCYCLLLKGDEKTCGVLRENFFLLFNFSSTLLTTYCPYKIDTMLLQFQLSVLIFWEGFGKFILRGVLFFEVDGCRCELSDCE